jgi:uncharacterized oxidoreductase
MILSGQTWLITGGATGIGLALARTACARGNTVVICGRREDALDRARAELPSLVTRRCDVSNAKDRAELAAWVADSHPNLSVLVNNAGVQYRRDFRNVQAAEGLDDEIAINFAAPIHLTIALLPILRQQKDALIVNVTSGLAFAPLAEFPVYCATKAAMHSLSLTLRRQLRTEPVRIVEMAPPLVDVWPELSVERPRGVPMLTPDEFVAEAMIQLEMDRNEILVGLSVETRKHGEALFESMNAWP